MGEVDQTPLPPNVTLAVRPLSRDGDDRKELTCMWCGMRECDGVVTLLGGGRMIVVGLHAHCLEMHDRVLEAREKRKSGK